MEQFFAIRVVDDFVELFGPFDDEEEARRYIAWHRKDERWDVQQPITVNA